MISLSASPLLLLLGAAMAALKTLFTQSLWRLKLELERAEAVGEASLLGPQNISPKPYEARARFGPKLAGFFEI